MKELNENIRRFREMRRMTQKSFAEQVGKSRNVISNWERGENSPDPDTIVLICRVLQVTPNQLFGWESCPDYERYIKRIEEYQQRVAELQLQQQAITAQLIKAQDDLFRAKLPEGM